MRTITLQPIAAAALRNLIRRRIDEIDATDPERAGGSLVYELREEAALLKQALRQLDD
jgi:hypothetical protein